MTSTSGITFDEISESVTGFDELAVEKHIGIDLYQDSTRKPVTFLRALVFIHLRHTGVKDLAAKDQTLSMPVSEVNQYFEDNKEANPDEPDTEAGKDEPSPAVEQPISQPSASRPA